MYCDDGSSTAGIQAMEMQQAILVRNAVDMCCRLPFLRHMPLKELFKLSKHLESVKFSKGQTILKQVRYRDQAHL